jgi:hypothetical protein
MPIRRLAIIGVLLLVAGYGLIKAWPLLSGPDIRISTPGKNAALPDGFLSLSGTAVHTQTLLLDGAPLLIDESGHFQTDLVLPHGNAILTLTATDRFGRSTSEQRTVSVQ